MASPESNVDLDRLLRLRLVVARVGEMDNARWWNTRGLLGRLGAVALSRGFPKSHRFAQAQAVFHAATLRCNEVFRPPACMTLWNLPAGLEDQFKSQWEHWLDGSSEWESFFQKVEAVGGADLMGSLLKLEVISEADASEARKLKRAAENRAVPIPGVHAPSDRILALLAAGFFRAEPGQLAVPYARVSD